MKRYLTGTITGLIAGIALNGMICLACSYALRLGYYAPCFTGLTEMCGGELNGALMQTCAFGLIGIAAGLVDCFLRQGKAAKNKRHSALR